MKTRSLLVILLLVALNISTGFCADPLSDAFRKGLYEEEANQNLQAAIEAYESVLKQLDAQRKIAAATVFRLGECYRKLGKTNDAVAQYQRIIREFSDQDVLANLSRQNLVGLGVPDETSGANLPSRFITGVAVPNLPDEEARAIARFKKLIEHSPDLIDAPNTKGRGLPQSPTPLQSAVQSGHVRVAEYLLENGADANAEGDMGKSPLHYAAEDGHKTMVELLLRHGADVNAGDETALHRSVRRGFRAVSEVLIAAGADVNAQKQSGLHVLWGNPHPSGTPLLYAIQRNDIAMVNLLLGSGANANAVSTESIAPLHAAAYEGNLEIVRALLMKGASVESRMTGTVTIGSRQPSNPFGPYGLRGSNREDCQGFSPLHFAVMNGHTEVAKLLIEKGARVDAKSSQDRTPLNLAATYGSPESVRLLLENGANPDSADSRESKSPLHSAVERNSNEIVRTVSRFNPNTELRDRGGYTPLHLAVSRQNHEIIRRLLAAGADPNAVFPGGGGMTPLHDAVQSRDKQLVEILLENKASVHAVDSSGKTVMDYLLSGDQSPSRPQSARGARGSLGGRDGQTEFSSAAESEILELLRKAGAEHDPTRSSQIRIGRDGIFYPMFFKGTYDNRYSALELIGTYSAGWKPSEVSSSPNVAMDFPLTFPDFANVVIRRSISGEENEIRLDLETAIRDADCAGDVPLEWGDIVEVPEAEHKLNAQWNGRAEIVAAVRKCLARSVQISVKGKWTTVAVTPFIQPDASSDTVLRRMMQIREQQRRANAIDGDSTASLGDPARENQNVESNEKPVSIAVESLRLKEVLLGSNLLLTSSDLTRVKVMRTDPITNEELEFILNLEDIDPKTDLWLLDGDKIEVPEKE